MAEFPSMPFWTDAYLGDTGHLTTLEHGAYLLLLFTAWRTKSGTLPDDDKMLARYCRLTSDKWKKIRPILEPFFEIQNGQWAQGRLMDERKANLEFRKSQSKKAKDRHLKNKESSIAAASSGQCPADASPSLSPSLPHKVDEEDDESGAISAPEIQMAVSIYNEAAKKKNLPVCQKLTETRKSKLRARIREAGGLEGWRSAVEKLTESSWCTGESEKGWKADFDFIIQEKSFTRLIEGFYDNRKGNGHEKTIRSLTKSERIDAALEAGVRAIEQHQQNENLAITDKTKLRDI